MIPATPQSAGADSPSSPGVVGTASGAARTAASLAPFVEEVGLPGDGARPASSMFVEGVPGGLGATGTPSPFGSDPSLPSARVGRGVNAAQTGTGEVRSPGLSGATTPAADPAHAAADQRGVSGPPRSLPALPRPFVEVRWCHNSACGKNRQHDLYGCAMRGFHREES